MFLVICLFVESQPNQIHSDSYKMAIEKAFFFEDTNIDSALYYGGKALDIAKEKKNKSNQLEALISLIVTEIKAAKNIEAIQHCQLANDIAVDIDNDEKHMEVLTYSGIVYRSIGLSKTALEYFFEAKKIADENDFYSEQGNIDYYLGSLYNDIGDLTKSINYTRKSISTLVEKEDENKLFKSYILLANSFTNLDSIQKYLSMAESLTEYYKNLKYERMVLRNTQALIYKALGSYEMSRSQYNEAISICITCGFNEDLSTLYNNYSYLMMAEKKYDSASYYLDKAFTLASELNNIDLEAVIYDSYSDYFKAIDDYPNALKYLELSMEKRKEYQARQRVKESLFLSAVFESDQKEKELLKKENNINQLKTTMLIILILMFLFIGIGVFFRMKFRLGKIRMEALKKGKDLEVADALITGQDVERKRIAMDLHDGIGAQFGSLRLLVGEPVNSPERVAEINQAVDAIYQEIRNISHRMLPPHLEAKGLVSAISEMISPINKSGKFEIEMQTNLERRLGNALELNLFMNWLTMQSNIPMAILSSFSFLIMRKQLICQ